MFEHVVGLQTGAASTSTGMLVVFGIVLLALVFFILEPIPIDVTAIGIIVVLVVLEPWTTIAPENGVAGFSSPATITVLAMFILSEGCAGRASSIGSVTGSSRLPAAIPGVSSRPSSGLRAALRGLSTTPRSSRS